MPPRPLPRPKTPRLGRPTGRFTQHRRMDALRDLLDTYSHGLPLGALAAKLKVTTRSVRRYLRELERVREIESIKERPGEPHLWRLKPSERGRTVALRRTQAFALLAARRVFDVLRGSALFDEIDVLLRDVAEVARRPALRSAVRGDAPVHGRLEDRFAYVPPVARGYAARADDVDEVFRAVAELRVLSFRYRDAASPASRARDGRDAKDGKGSRLSVHPYALVMHGGDIGCIARDPDRDGAAMFLLDRMSDVQASEAEFYELPADFVIDDWLQGDFGVARSARTVRLLVEFDARVADAIRGRRVHPSQKLAVAQDGRIRASLAIPDTAEVRARLRAWLLGFGSAARVLEPRELADDIAAELRRATSRYET